jgi:ribonucleoside-diphosphate reductase alpha chain
LDIEQKIVGVRVAKDVEPVKAVVPALLGRPDVVHGQTYKIKPGEHPAMYITINDVVVDGKRRPFEMFINSKSMESYQWIVALTRVVSAVFRSTPDPQFLVEELKSVFDPRGGYWQSGGVYHSSIVAGIGAILEQHITGEAKTVPHTGMPCPKCGSLSLVRESGCETCKACDYSRCG